MKKIYLAGFDVFRFDALEWGERLKALCREHGFEGLYPMDNDAPSALTGFALAQWICKANLALLREADAVMGNMNAFRGHEPDSGTVFELGYAAALGKPIWAYTDESRSLVDQIAVNRSDASPDRYLDAQGYTVEDFGLNLNLMIACSAQVVVGTAWDCLAAMAKSLTAD